MKTSSFVSSSGEIKQKEHELCFEFHNKRSYADYIKTFFLIICPTQILQTWNCKHQRVIVHYKHGLQPLLITNDIKIIVLD